ncbi:MAG: NAD-dependent epimerase/dehydratase family protein [Flavobacteriaceae bacterium]|nr:NAD-dependent epimerase/dehydratase family protein [Flavobacteriaceae bacterium]|tara:strand:+ start:32844 stop:33698 length:855 start_codon:yes stop_codon:yes gene_type:complete
MNKKVLVTGGAGFIGSNLIKQLLSKGYNVSSIDNYDSGSEDNHIDGCTYYKGDVVEWLPNNNRDFDICFHLAGLSRIQPSFTNPDNTIRINTIGTQKVLEFARKNNTMVIYAGSSSRWHNPYQSPYATSKYLGEELCKMYRKTYDLHIEIARFYNVYGPGEIIDGDWAAVTGIWRRQVRDGKNITIVGDGEQRRDFTYVGDIVDGLIKIAESRERHDDAWEFGTGMNYSINEVYEMFKSRFGVEKEHVADQNGNYRKTLRENNDSLERLGWKPVDRLNKYISEL